MDIKITIIFQLIAIYLALGLFLKGFFPLKKTWNTKQRNTIIKSTGLIAETNGYSNIFKQTSNASVASQNGPHFRIILMVIDAFREDFAYGPLRFLPLTHGILNKGKGLKFTAETTPPTVTLPRIKAMVTGSTSSFADVVLNFGSSALEEDNIISRLKAHERRVVFYGDDTWLKLFPTHFLRSDGTTSFFVADYTEVDYNVTRHLNAELENPTWDVLILHYLGLDHIGHLAGPRSPLIGPKLAEMDRIIQHIYTAMEKWTEPSMLIVSGDHGMSDQGGHGGASPGEITVPVLFLSPQIFNSDPKHFGTISQIDLCPTLAVLQGVPIPSGNIGKIVTEALIGFPLQEKVTLLYHNAQQSLSILKDCITDLQKESAFLLFKKTEENLQKWFMSKNSSTLASWEDEGDILITSFNEVLTLISEKVSTLATSYDVYAMAVSIFLMWMILVSVVLSSTREQQEKERSMTAVLQLYGASVGPVIGSALLSHIIMCTGGVPSDTVCSSSVSGVLLQVALVSTCVGLALHIISSWTSLYTLGNQVKVMCSSCSLVEVVLLGGIAGHSATLLSSSFVEEEHQTFFFLVTTVHFLVLAQLAVWYIQRFHVVHGRCQQKHEALTFSTKLGEVWYWGHGVNQVKGRIGTSACAESTETCSDDVYEKSLGCDTSTQSQRKNGEEIVQEKEEDLHLMQQPVSKMNGGGDNAQPCLTRSSFLHWTFNVVVVLLMLRVLRRWNHTGSKWLDSPDFGDWLVMPENRSYLSLLTVFAFMIIAVSRGSRLRRVQTMCVNLSLCCAYLCRAAEGSLVFPYRKFLSSSGLSEARASYFFIVLTCGISLLPENFLKLENKGRQSQAPQPSPKSSKAALKSSSNPLRTENENQSKVNQLDQVDLRLKTKAVDATFDPSEDDGFSFQHRLRGVMAATICFACLVKQPHNAPVLAVMSLAEQMMTPVLTQIGCRPAFAVVYTAWMGQVFFFLQGNSNSLSSVDVAASYVGLDEYWPAMNGILLFLATYVGSVFWSLACLNFLAMTQKEQPREKRQKLRSSGRLTSSCQALLLTRVMPLSVYMALVAAQRYHLFVWSVFSPKMLYEAASTVVVGVQLLTFAICSISLG